MRNRGPQKQTPQMWCMGAEDPLACPAGPLPCNLLLVLLPDEGDGATSGLDGGASGRAGRVGLNRQAAPQLAACEKLDRHAIGGDARPVESLGADLGAVFEPVELGEVDHGVDPFEGVVEAAYLGQPLAQR